jgi:hypothetical protein
MGIKQQKGYQASLKDGIRIAKIAKQICTEQHGKWREN